MKTLVVQSQTEVGGAESCLLTLLPAAARSGIEPTVAVLGFGHGDLPARLRSAGIETFELRAGRLRNPLAWARTVLRLARLARRSGCEVLLANGYHPHLYAGPAARLSRKRSAVFCHDLPAAPGAPAPLAERASFRLRADVYLAPSGAAVMAVRRRTGSRAPVHLVPDSVDPERFAPSADARAAVRRELGLAPEHLVITVAGRLSPGKGQHVFLEAAARVAAEIPEARFLLVGAALFGMETDCPRELREQARRLNIAERTVFAGNRADMSAVYAATDVVAVPSVAPESFGLVALEAMSAGRPVAVSRAGALGELFEEGVSGLGFEPGDAAQLAARLLDLCRDAGLRGRLGAAARERARRFSPAAAAGALAQALGAAPFRARPGDAGGPLLTVLSGAWPPERGGVADHSRLLAAALAAAGGSAEGITTGAEPAPPLPGEAPVRRIAADWTVRGAARLARALAAGGARRVVFFQYVPHLYSRRGLPLGAALLPLLARRRGVRFITHFHEVCVDWSWHPLHLVQSLLQRLLAAQMVAGSHAISFSTARYVPLLRVPLRLLRRRWAVLPSGATAPDAPVTAEMRAEARLRWAPSAPDSHARLGVIYGLASRGKRYDLALAALGELVRRGLDIRLLMLGDQEAGDAGLCREIRARAAADGLAGRLAWTGPLPAGEIASALACADWMWHLESSGLTARSGTAACALAQGLPVIGFSGRGLDSFFRDGENVLLAREMSAAALADASARLAGDRELEARLRSGGRRLFEEVFSWKTTAAACRRLAAGEGE